MYSITVLYLPSEENTFLGIENLINKHASVKSTLAMNEQELLSLYQENKYDLIIIDINDLKIHNFEVIRTIKKQYDEQFIMVITTINDTQDFTSFLELGVNYFIDKPIDALKFNQNINNCCKKIQEKKESELTNTLLTQYQYVIDESTILSKTDIKGHITYANKAFYKISQYSKKECIGQTHNLIKNPKMNNKVFQSLWKTISRKKQWRGIISNRAKDGSEYIVDSLILPILDTNNNIIEYIGIRHDITKIKHFNLDLQKKLDIAVKDIVDTQKEVLFTMGSIGETRSKETGNHVKRVAEYSYVLAKLAGLNEKKAELLKLASPMHDIGKVGIPDAILNKPDKLTIEEFEVMKTHSLLGYEMLKNSKREIMKTSAIVAYEHHEKWDGTGYPQGLSQNNIHIYGRITAICDVFDALGSSRCYKKAWKLDDILKFFHKEKGKHFDPSLVELFLDNLNKFLEIRDEYHD